VRAGQGFPDTCELLIKPGLERSFVHPTILLSPGLYRLALGA
jgi:hypothetical protein